MPVLNPNTTEGQTALGIIADALIEIGAIAQGDGIPSDMGQWCLRKLNRMMDQWAARRLFIYDQTFTAYTLTPNLNPHTIGPGGTFDVAQRPTRIVSVAVILNNVSVAIDVPIPVLDDDQWAAVSAKPLTSTQPIAVYYAAGWPLGSLYFWPIPTTAYGVRLETWSTLTQFADLSTVFTLPPGYWDAVVKALAIDLCPGLNRPATPELVKGAMDAKAAIQSLNSTAPKLQTAQAGMSANKRGDFNYRTGM